MNTGSYIFLTQINASPGNYSCHHVPSTTLTGRGGRAFAENQVDYYNSGSIGGKYL
jgi:hypothetical protein